ncbi:DNA topoisomerase 3-alpha isoform X2 [Euwallacea fornicatus]|uniref:DNA topoisomerase 3-alpha isoform X2 n=1 Tax=Euwallacea fornicatus TaxID=995702 RepID=UPI00338F5BC2
MGYLQNLISNLHLRRFYGTQVKATIMKYLNVAEKNDAAKNIAAILARGHSQRREGLSPYNKIYEFTAQVFGENCQMVMTSVSGHLLNYEFGIMYRNWQSCNPLVLFDAPVTKACPKDYEKVKKTLEREIRSCQGLIIWTDCDREGENIGYEIIKVCTDIKPQLRIYRAKFSEITSASVFRALNTLGQPNKNISDAVDVRQELDLRTGAAFTRLQTLRFQQVFPNKLSDKLISYGSCQFPTLGFVVERYQAIEEFIPEAFWRIKMNHTVKELTTDFSWKRDRLFDKNSCEAILDHCKENSLAKVESVESKPKSKWRPLPLDTVEMEKNISRKLRINAKDTMKIAEKLYTQGFISYPRTETNIFPKELNLINLVEQQQDDNEWGLFARRILAEGGPNPRQGKKSDQAHPPIHPTKYANNLQGNDKRVYEYIVRHFLGCVHKDAQGFETTVNVDIAGEKFTAKGLIILERNYLDVYTYEKWNAKEINNYEQGDTFIPTVLEMAESQTSPPKLLTEADLIALMEKHGIGTDATHADHIDTIKSREYVGLNDIYFVPGRLGMGLVEGYNDIGLEVSLAKPTLRAEFENNLKLICEGHKDPEVVRREQIEKYKAVFTTVAEKMRLIDNTLSNRLGDQAQQTQDPIVNVGGRDDFRPVCKCPKCGRDMVLRTKKDGVGKYITCTGFPDCKNSVWFPSMVKNVEVTDQHCPQCGPDCKRLRFTFRPNPFPGDPNPNTLCICGCDENVIESLDINLVNVSRVNGARATTRNNLPVRANPEPRPAENLNQLQNRANNQHNQYESSSAPRTQTLNTFFNNSPIGSTNSGSTEGGTFRPNLDNMPGPSGSNSNRSSFGNFTNPGDTSRRNDIVCQCDQEAILLTVKKNGPNKGLKPIYILIIIVKFILLSSHNIGKQFYKCAQSACNFFAWNTLNDSNTTQTSNNHQNSTRMMGSVTEIQCKCNQNAALRTVNKEGPNKGRQFYCCPNMTGGCKFFQWADEADDRGGGRGGGDDGDDHRGGGGWGDDGGSNLNWSFKGKASRGKGKNRAAPYAKTKTGGSTGTRAKRKCGKCAQEGHTKNHCPN